MTAMSETLERPAEARHERTGDAALTAWQVAYEQRAFWRNRTRAFFSFGMPVMLLLLFGALNSGGRIQELGNIPYVTFFLPGILAYGIIITQFVNMAGGIAIQRDNGLLKRMRGTPLPGWAYVGGRVGSTAGRLDRHDRRHARSSAASASTCTCAPRRCRPSPSPCCWARPPSPRWAWPPS